MGGSAPGTTAPSNIPGPSGSKSNDSLRTASSENFVSAEQDAPEADRMDIQSNSESESWQDKARKTLWKDVEPIKVDWLDSKYDHCFTVKYVHLIE